MPLNLFKLVMYSLSLFLLFCTAWLMDSRVGGTPLSVRETILFFFLVIIAGASTVQLIRTGYFFYDTFVPFSKNWTSKNKNLMALNSTLIWMLVLMLISYALTK